MGNPYAARIKLSSIKGVQQRLAGGSNTWGNVAVIDVDLGPVDEELAKQDLRGCVFLGCDMSTAVRLAAAAADCLIVPRFQGLPFDPFLPGVYTPEDLYDAFDPTDPEGSYRKCRDYRIYTSYADPVTREVYNPIPVEVSLARRIHDQMVDEDLRDIIEMWEKPASGKLGLVAIMGGHELKRARFAPDSKEYSAYMNVAFLGKRLTNRKFVVVTGGGPGAMEAANLGAYMAHESDAAIEKAVEKLEAEPVIRDGHEGAWMKAAMDVKLAWPLDKDTAEARASIGIPTWYYGHEPPNVFTSHIAKYFENSLREEGLLAIGKAGVVYAEGNAGTVQEIFQDANQNYYKLYDYASPMVLLGIKYWNADTVPNSENQKPAYPLLKQLAAEKGFSELLLLTDSLAETEEFIVNFKPPN